MHMRARWIAAFLATVMVMCVLLITPLGGFFPETRADSSVDLSITKTASSSTPLVGYDVTFTITVVNHGPDPATGVNVWDELPAGLTYVSSSATWGSYNPGTHVWAIGAMANGSSATLHMATTVTQVGTITNDALVDGDEPDPVNANSTASAAITGMMPVVDLSITKTVDIDTQLVGSDVTFTITVVNHGPDPATGVNVWDELPAGLTYVSSSATWGSYNPGTHVWAIGAMANGSSATLHMATTVTQVGTITNDALVDGDEPDPVSANSTASVTVTGTMFAADLAITKTVDIGIQIVGRDVVFTVTVTNHGPDPATNVNVTDTLPAGLTYVSSSASQGSYNSGTHIWAIGAMANAAVETLHIVATVAQTGVMTNSALVDGEEADQVPANNTAATVVTGRLLAVDLSITKTASSSAPLVGYDVTFTVTVANHGPDPATNVNVTDTLPAGLTYVSSSASQGSYNSGTHIWAIGAMANAAVETLHIVATVAQTGAMTNSALVDGEEADQVPANNAAAAVVTGRLLAVDLSITKTASSSAPLVGYDVTFAVTVANHGPDPATNVNVADTLPAGLTYVSSSASQGSYNSGTHLWTIGSMANASIETLHIVATVAQTGAIINTAVADAVEADPVPTNNMASVMVTGTTPAPALTINKAPLEQDVTPDQNVTLTIVATNSGNTELTGVEIQDSLPAGFYFVSSQPPVVTLGSMTMVVAPQPGDTSLTFREWTLQPGGTVSITFAVHVPAETHWGTYSNSALVQALYAGPAVPPVTVGPVVTTQPAQVTVRLPEIHLVKSVSPMGAVFPGARLTYTLTFSNTGNAATSPDTVVTDVLDGWLDESTLSNISGWGGSYDHTNRTLTWTVGSIAPGGSWGSPSR